MFFIVFWSEGRGGRWPLFLQKKFFRLWRKEPLASLALFLPFCTMKLFFYWIAENHFLTTCDCQHIIYYLLLHVRNPKTSTIPGTEDVMLYEKQRISKYRHYPLKGLCTFCRTKNTMSTELQQTYIVWR